MIRVLIADDHAIVREGLKRIIEQSPEMSVVAEAGDSATVLEQARRTEPDLVVLDVSMPGRGGLEVLKELKQRRREQRVLILSMHPEDQLAVRFLREGADGYLTKESAPERLLEAIRKICGGGKYLSPTLAERLAMAVDRNLPETQHELLSDRELQVLTLIGAGKTPSEIAEELHLSVKTISTYRARLLEKMGMRNNAQLMLYALQHGLVP